MSPADPGCGHLCPFGREDLSLERRCAFVSGCLDPPDGCIAEVVRRIYYTGPARCRNVRIKSSNVCVEYWDGREWWTMGVSDAVDIMVGTAVDEIGHALDYDDALGDDTRAAAEGRLAAFSSDAEERRRVRAQVVEVMIVPLPEEPEREK